MAANDQCAKGKSPPEAKPAISALEATLELARRGNRDILPRLRAALNENPQIWKHYGDLATASQEAWLQRIAGNNLLVLESARRQAEAFKQELLGDHPTPLEKVIVERLAAAWLASMYADIAASAETGTGKVAAFLLKRAETAQRLFLNTARSLALIRRLLIRPVVIVKEQVAASPSPAFFDSRHAGAGRMSKRAPQTTAHQSCLSNRAN